MLEPQSRFHWIFITSVLCELEDFAAAELIIKKSKNISIEHPLNEELVNIFSKYKMMENAPHQYFLRVQFIISPRN